MVSNTVPICKFVGTVSLGLLTGISYNTALLTLPPLLALPSASEAQSTFAALRNQTIAHTTALSAIAATAFVAAYAISPPRARHPYLLYATFAIALGYSPDVYAFFVAGGKKVAAKAKDVKEERKQGRSGVTPETSDEEWEVEASGMRREVLHVAGGDDDNDGLFNGEGVKEGIIAWRRGMAGRGIAWGLGWILCTVGIWGDGF